MNKSEGLKIVIKFDNDIVSDASGNEDAFTIKVNEYDFVPGGTLVEKIKKVASVHNPNYFSERINIVNDLSSHFKRVKLADALTLAPMDKYPVDIEDFSGDLKYSRFYGLHLGGEIDG